MNAQDAVEAMDNHLETNWDGTQFDPVVEFVSLFEPDNPNEKKSCVRIRRIQHLVGNQATLGSPALYDREGIIFIKIAPWVEDDNSPDFQKKAHLRTYEVAQAVVNIFQGKEAVGTGGSVWFRDFRFDEDLREFGVSQPFGMNGDTSVYSGFGDKGFDVIGEFSYSQEYP